MNRLKKFAARAFLNHYALATGICLLIYIIKYRPEEINYFRDLAFAVLHGRLNLTHTPSIHDLAFFHGKYYPYWPPAPALIFIPLVALFGYNIPDGLVSSLIGGLNVWLVMQICARLSDRFSLKISAKMIFWIGLFWGLGTVHFYMAKSGTVWLIAQIIAQCFLLLSIYFFLDNKRLLLSGLFFGLAVFSRNDLVFSFLFFAALYVSMNPQKKFQNAIIPAIVFLLPFGVFALLNFWYNYVRFGNIFDNGLNYHLMADYFRDNFNHYGFFSLHYFPHNFYTEVLHWPTFTKALPFIQEEPEGFGFIWGSPVFLLLIPVLFVWVFNLFNKKVDIPYKLITTTSLVSAMLIAFLIFLIMGTGWAQFCARYTLDFQFFLVVFLLFSWKYIARLPLVKQLTILLLFASLVIQGIGGWQ